MLLGAGTYTIGGFSSGATDATSFAAATIATLPGINYLGSRSDAGGGIVDPAGDAFNNARSYSGPNFQVQTATVPDTGSTLALLGLGVSGLLTIQRLTRFSA